MSTTIIIASLALLAAFMRPFTTLIHELGHGLTAFFLIREKITLYIGSYGDPAESFHFQIGRLEFYIKRNPFHWRLGLCYPHNDNIPNNRMLAITLMGPITSLLVGSIGFYLTIYYDLHGIIKVLGAVFLGSCLFDFFGNIVPRKEPFYMYDGSVGYNDGHLLMMLLKFRSSSSDYKKGVTHYNQEEYKQAGRFFHSLIKKGHKDDLLFRLGVSSFAFIKDYKTAFEINKLFEKTGKFDSNDFTHAGLIKSQLGIHDKALLDYEKALELYPNNKNALNNRGYTYILLYDYEKSIPDFDKAIEIDSQFSYSYSNRGLAKIKIGLREEGLNDINIAIELDNKNAYSYLNFGIYYYDVEDYSNALIQFEKAEALDKDTYSLQDYLRNTKKALKSG